MQLILLGTLNKIKNPLAFMFVTAFYLHSIFKKKWVVFPILQIRKEKLRGLACIERHNEACWARMHSRLIRSETTHLTSSTSRSSLPELQARPALLGGVSALTPGNQKWLARKQRKRRKSLPSFLSQEFSGLLLFGLTTTTRILARSNMISHI